MVAICQHLLESDLPDGSHSNLTFEELVPTEQAM